MTCDNAQLNIMLAQYGELPDELQFPLEQHLHLCEECRREWNANLALHEELALVPLEEPSPNLLAATRMRLDEALDAMPSRSVTQRLWGNAFRWMGFLQGAPALTTLLVGIGFLTGTVFSRYQEMHAVKLPAPVILSSPNGGAIASVSGIVQTPNSDIVQVQYNRLVPESVQGSLDDPQIRQLLMLGTKLAANNDVQTTSVNLVVDQCRIPHHCAKGADGANDFRTALLTELRYDKNPAERKRALTGLEPYISEDEQVRDAVLDALMHDKSAEVRAAAITLLPPVQADSSVRQVLRTVSSQDTNPAIRNASFVVLQGAANIE